MVEAPAEIYPEDIVGFDFGGYMCGAFPTYLCAWRVNVSDRIKQQYPDIEAYYCIIKDEANYEDEVLKVKRALDQGILKLKLSHIFADKIAFYKWVLTEPLQLAPPVLFSEDIVGNKKPPGALYWTGPSPTLVTFAVDVKDWGCSYGVGVSDRIRTLYPGDYLIMIDCEYYVDISKHYDEIWRRGELWLKLSKTWIDNYYYEWVPVIIKSCKADKTQVSYGDQITITVTLKNTDWKRARSVTVGLYKEDGNTWTYPKSVAIGINSEETITFTFRIYDLEQAKKGIYVRVGDVEMKCVTINVVGVPDIRVDSITVDRTTVNVGDRVRATAKVTNHGTAPGSATLYFTLNGEIISETPISLRAGESQELYTYVGPFESTGTFEICAEVG